MIKKVGVSQRKELLLIEKDAHLQRKIQLDCKLINTFKDS